MRNLQGDVIGIMNRSGNLVARYSYDAWGACTILSDTTGNIAALNPFRYRGYYFDTETNLYYLQSRYYDPLTGRFINADEAIMVSIRDTVLCSNAFGYCDNNAVMGYDPSGYYNRANAVAYAKEWYNKRNKEYYSYSTDCANFVSQCLYAGGIQMTPMWHSYKSFNLSKHLWDIRSIISYKFWYDWDVTESWRLAKKQFKFFANSSNGYIHGKTVTIASADKIADAVKKYSIQAGDLLYFAGKTGNSVHHATMIAKVKNGKIYYTAHTRSRWEHDLSKSMKAEQVIVVRMKYNAC